jgi:hypothetical protein
MRRLVVCAALAAVACVEVEDGAELGSSSAEVSVTWTNLVGVTATGNDLIKSGGISAWNAGAVSVETLAGDGYVEFTTAETSTTKTAGLSNGDGGQDHADIDFAIRLRSNGSVGVYEAGVLRGSFGTYAPGDVFRVEVEAGVVTYRKNGALLTTSAVAPAFPLLVDTALLNPGATIADVELVATSLDWQNLVGVTVTGTDLTKSATTTGWSAGASSVQPLSGDGFVEFVAGEATTAKAAGLSSDDAGTHYSDIDFAIRLNAVGRVHVYEGGVLRGAFGTYVAGDRFRVEVTGGVVQYSRNGARPFYTSAAAPTFPLRIDTSFLTTGGTLRGFVLAPAADACPAYDGSGVVCNGSFYLYNEFDVAEIAHCASITGNITVLAPGMTEISLPKLERVGGTLIVDDSTDLVYLRLPALKQVGSIRLVLDPGIRAVDLSRLRTAASQVYSYSPVELSAPCLESTGALYAFNRTNPATAESAYVPRLREVVNSLQAGRITTPALETAGELAASYLSAPVLVSVTEGVFGEVDAPALVTVGGDVGARPFDAPSLTDIGGTLNYYAGQDLPALERAGGLILIDAPVTDLPALVEIDGRLAGVSCFGSGIPVATEVALPSLQRVGSLALCWDTLTAVNLPALEAITGPASNQPVLRISSTALTSVELPSLVDVEAGGVEVPIPLSVPALATIGGQLNVYAPLTAPSLTAAGGIYHTTSLSLPALEQVGGALDSRAPLSAPALTEVGGLLRIQYLPAQTSLSFPSLATVGGLYLDSFNLTGFDVPSLSVCGGSIRVRSTRIPSLVLPLVATIPGDLVISNNDSMTSIDFSSLTALGPTLNVTGNAVLPTCYATDLRDQLITNGWTGTATINANGSGTCP